MRYPLPTINSKWRRIDNHNKYTVTKVANADTKGKNRIEYPTIVVFESGTKVRAMLLEEFYERMELVPNGR